MTEFKRVRVDRTLGSGVVAEYAPDKPTSFHMQIDTSEGPLVLEFGWNDAMYVLSMLKAAQMDTNTPFPDDPRARDG